MCDQQIIYEVPDFELQNCSHMQCEIPTAYKTCQVASNSYNCACNMDCCYEQPPRQAMCKPEVSYVRPTQPIDTNTIYKCSYVENQGYKRTVPIHVEDSIKPFEGRMECNTIQKLSFQPHCIVGRVKPLKPKSNTQRFDGQFFDITSQKHDYVPKCYSKRQPLRVSDGILKFCEPLEKSTVNKLTYLPYDICSNPPPKPMIQTGHYIRPDAPGEHCTVQKLSYLPVPLPAKEDMPWAKKVRVEPPQSGPLCTTYKLSFIPNCNTKRVRALVPEQAIKIFGSELPNENTVYKHSYLNSCGTKPAPIMPKPGIEFPSGEMEKCTVYKLSYKPQNGSERTKAIRPKGNVCKSNAPIQDITTQKHDFVPKRNCRRGLIIPPTSMCTPSSPMEKCTVNKLSYLPQESCAKIGPILPRPGLSKFDAPMAKCTTYKLSYLPVPIPPKEILPWARQTSCERPTAPIQKCTIQKLSYGAPGKFLRKEKKKDLKKFKSKFNIANFELLVSNKKGGFLENLVMDMEVEDENLSDQREHRNNVIHYILNNSSSKYPLKNSEIITRALNGKASLFNQVISGVKDALENTYGILLKTVPDTKGGKQYICVSKFPAVTSNEFDELQRSQITLLFIVLSYIFMKGVPVSEEFLEEFLKGLNIYFDKSHPFFGSNIKKLITETFVKQLYLKKTKSEKDAIENELFYSWGYRSEEEFPKKEVLDAVSKLLNKPAKHFVLQFMQANSADSSN